MRKSWWTFDRSDWIGTGIAMIAVWAMTAFGIVGIPLWRWWQGRDLRINIDAKAAGGDVEPAVVTTTVAGAGTVERLVSLVPAVLTTVALGVALWLFLGILRRIVDGRTFEAGNARRWRVLAAAALVVPIVIAFVQMAVDQIIARRLDLPLQGLGVTIEPTWILVGLLCAAVGEAFAEGARQREDLEGVV